MAEFKNTSNFKKLASSYSGGVEKSSFYQKSVKMCHFPALGELKKNPIFTKLAKSATFLLPPFENAFFFSKSAKM